MKITRMVIGIISLVLSLLILLQSCAVGVGNIVTESGEVSGTVGFILAICMIVSGILGVCCRKGRTGTIVASCFYALGGLFIIGNSGTYTDLKVWAFISFTFALVFALTAIWQREKLLD